MGHTAFTAPFKNQSSNIGWQNFNNIVEDIGYGVANMFGLGEVANDIINWIKSWFGDTATTTQRSAELIQRLVRTLGSKSTKLNQILSYIDNKLSSLPAEYSQNSKKVLRSMRATLLNKRSEVVKDLNAVEQSLNTGLSTAYGQDSASPSNKRKNQQFITSLIKKNEDIDPSAIEQTIK